MKRTFLTSLVHLELNLAIVYFMGIYYRRVSRDADSLHHVKTLLVYNFGNTNGIVLQTPKILPHHFPGCDTFKGMKDLACCCRASGGRIYFKDRRTAQAPTYMTPKACKTERNRAGQPRCCQEGPEQEAEVEISSCIASDVCSGLPCPNWIMNGCRMD